MWVISNWKSVAVVIYTLLVIYFTHAIDRGIYDRLLDKKISAQILADQNQCNADKEKTRIANDKLQTERDHIAAALATYKRLHPVRRIVPAEQPELRRDRAEYAGRDGAVAGNSDDFRDYAARCETYRTELITCIDFLGVERK